MEFALDLVESYGSDPRITDLLEAGARRRRPGRQRRRLRPVPHRRRDRRPPRGQRLRPARGLGVDTRHARPRLQAQELPCRRRPGHPRRHLRRLRPRAPAASASASTSTATTAPSGAAPAPRPEPDPAAVEGGVLDPTYRGPSAFSEPETPERPRPHREPAGDDDDHQPHLLQPGAAPHRREPRHRRSRRRPGRRCPGRGGAEARSARGWRPRTATPTTTAGSSTTPPARPRTSPTTRPAATATPSRSGPTSSTRRTQTWSTSTSAPGDYAGKGNREAYLNRAGARRRPRPRSGVLVGRAPKGAKLRLREALRDPHLGGLVRGRRRHRDPSASGAFELGGEPVDPAGRPAAELPEAGGGALRRATIDRGDQRATPGGHTDHEFVLASTTSPCGAPSSTGPRPTTSTSRSTAVRAASWSRSAPRATPPGSKESVDLAGAEAWTYVLRVLNYASASPVVHPDRVLLRRPDAHHAGHPRELHLHL